MKIKPILLCLFFYGATMMNSFAQCSLCTKTAQQLGEKPALGLNNGILYLMATPLIIIAVIGIRWWRTEGRNNHEG
jgi:hypothetical protein